MSWPGSAKSNNCHSNVGHSTCQREPINQPVNYLISACRRQTAVHTTGLSSAGKDELWWPTLNYVRLVIWYRFLLCQLVLNCTKDVLYPLSPECTYRILWRILFMCDLSLSCPLVVSTECMFKTSERCLKGDL